MSSRTLIDRFRVAVRKLEHEIVDYARTGGGTVEYAETRAALVRAKERLWDRCGAPEIRGDAALSEEAHETCRRIGAALLAADELAHQARQTARDAQIAALTEAERERWRNMDPYDRELAMRRARR